MECRDCKYWVSKQDRAIAKGKCHRYPDDSTKFSDHWCGEFEANQGPKRPDMMKELCALGVKVNPKWKNDEMLKEIEDARQKAKAEDGSGEEQAEV